MHGLIVSSDTLSLCQKEKPKTNILVQQADLQELWRPELVQPLPGVTNVPGVREVEVRRGQYLLQHGRVPPIGG